MSFLKVWSKFSVARRDGTIVNLRIQDMPADKFDDVIDFIMEHFVKHETFHKAAGVHKSPEALHECRNFASEMMKDPSQHITICCLDDSDSVKELLGVSTISLTTKDEDDFDLKLQTQEMNKMFELMEVANSTYDVMKQQDVETSYDDRGLVVHPDYRGLGIATEFFKVRVLVCKEQGVPLTWACMTSLGSQKAAERAGWHTASKVSFADLEKQCGVFFEGAPTFHKIMFFRV